MFSNITNILNSFRANPGETLIYLLMLAFCLSMVILLSYLTHKWLVTPIQQHLLSYMNKKNNNG